MKLTLSNIKELKRKSDSPLTRLVCNYVIDRWDDYDDKKHIFTDVLHYGCQSGVVGELIYYSDTVRFYKQYRQAINLGHGFNVGWDAEELPSRPKQFEDGKGYPADTRYYDPYATLINRGVVGKFPEYKYSAYQLYEGRVSWETL